MIDPKVKESLEALVESCVVNEAYECIFCGMNMRGKGKHYKDCPVTLAKEILNDEK